MAAFAVVLVLSAGLFVVALRISKGLTGKVAGFAALVLVAALVAFMTTVRDSLVFARLMPISSVLVAADLMLPLAALLAGVLAASLPERRRMLLPIVLLLTAAIYSARPLIAKPPKLDGRAAVRGVIPQTSDASCGAASAATLLLTEGIPATEPEMARLCRTTKDGTEMLGIYRGLSIKARGSGLGVGALSGASVEELFRTAKEHGPVLIVVGLPRVSLRPVDPRYENDWGWTPGLHHAVVFFGVLPNGKIDMGDPSAGREAWSRQALDVLWNGEGLYLVRR